jgi:hypothetical protein
MALGANLHATWDILALAPTPSLNMPLVMLCVIMFRVAFIPCHVATTLESPISVHHNHSLEPTIILTMRINVGSCHVLAHFKSLIISTGHKAFLLGNYCV